MMNADKPFGPFQVHETREFLSSVVHGHKDSLNHRFNLDAAAEDLAGKRFDSAEAWLTLEANRLNKRNARSYNA